MKILSDNLYEWLHENDLQDVILALESIESDKDYFDFSSTDASKISYLKSDRIPENKDLLYDADYRRSKAFHTKIGKLISNKVDNATIQKTSSLLYARKEKDNIRLTVTDNICHYYHEDNYAEKRGTLGNSCMRHDSCQEYIKFYESIPDVKLLVALDSNDKVLGRALLWYNVESEQGAIDYLDRIYSVNDNINQLFYDYANENNIMLRRDRSCELKYYVNIDRTQPLPYFDSFVYYNRDGYLSTYNGDVALDSVNGDCLDDIDGYSCYECGCHVSQDCGWYSNYVNDYLCESCGVYIESLDDVIPADECVTINGQYYHKESNDVIYSDYENDYILFEEAIHCEYEDVYVHQDSNYIFSEYHDQYFTDNCSDLVYSEHHQDYYLKDTPDIIFSSFHSDWLLKCDSKIKYSKSLRDYIIASSDKIAYIQSENDYFDIESNHVYFDETLQQYRHKQYTLF